MPANRKPAIAIVGAGSLATSLALALRDAGYRITQIMSREPASSRQRARKLAARVGARAVTISRPQITASLLWFCVPDREIRSAASAFASAVEATRAVEGNTKELISGTVVSSVHPRVPRGKTLSFAPREASASIAFHSSGALPSAELDALRKQGVAAAAVHPLMTFVPGSRPSLAGVPFALEGDAAATKLARRIVRDLSGESFSLPASRKSAYHAWATMTSPLLLSFLVTLEEAARMAGVNPAGARRMSLPIIRQTLANYGRLGPAPSFSGPIIRGDVKVVAGHLKVLKKIPEVKEVYVALAHAALCKLPAKNRRELGRLLKIEPRKSY